MNNAITTPAFSIAAGQLRPLKWDERVNQGDFVAAEPGQFEVWEGPAGFRADTFVKQVYRRLKKPAAEAKKAF
jgi:GH24 family phage-related lysozyme (muramidase)